MLLHDQLQYSCVQVHCITLAELFVRECISTRHNALSIGRAHITISAAVAYS